MFLVQVYGMGCAKCKATAEIIEKTARELGVEIMLEKVQDINRISDAGILRTPGVMVDGEIKKTGNIPTAAEIKSWFGK